MRHPVIPIFLLTNQYERVSMIPHSTEINQRVRKSHEKPQPTTTVEELVVSALETIKEKRYATFHASKSFRCGAAAAASTVYGHYNNQLLRSQRCTGSICC